MNSGIRLISICVAIMIFSLLPVNRVSCNQPPVDISGEVDRTRCQIGDVITFSIHAEAPAGTRIIFPGESLELTPFVILDRRLGPPQKTDQSIQETLILSISIYRAGDFEIPSVDVQWQLQDGTAGSSHTEPQFIRVESVLTEEETTFRSIKETFGFEARSRYIVLTLAGIMTLIALIVVLVRIIMSLHLKAEKTSEMMPEPLRPADEIALEALARLRESSLLIQGNRKEYFVLLTEILKVYLGRRYAFRAPERTTGEIRNDLRKLSVDSTVQSDVMRILDLADMVKFAKFLPPDNQCRQVLNDAEKIVLHTRDAVNQPSAMLQQKTEEMPV